jgi:tetratricopeptide (TPR) repeat protein
MNQNDLDNGYDDEPEPEVNEQARQVLNIYDQASASELDDPIKWFELGILSAQSGWSEQSVRSFAKSLSLQPAQAPAWYYMGVVLVELTRYKEAALAFDKSLEFDATDPDAWLDKGLVLEILDRPDEALGAYNKCLKLDGHNPEALYHKRILAEDTSDEGLDRLLDICDKALKQNPQDSKALFNKGFVLAEMFKNEEAMMAFESLLELHPGDMLVFSKVGMTLYRLAMSQEALVVFKDALRFNPRSAHAWYYKGETSLSLGPQQYYAVAYAAYDKATQINPAHYLAWYKMGCALAYYAGEPARALEALDRVTELKPDWAPAWQTRGGVLISLDKYDEALDSYTKAIEAQPDYYDTWYDRAKFLAAAKDSQRALDDLAKAIELNSACKKTAPAEDAFYFLLKDQRFQNLVNT